MFARWLSTLFLLFAGAGSSAQEVYALGPESQRQPDVPRGTVTHHVWRSTGVFPGTIREYWVYVPAQIDEQTPAALMVFQDGHAYVSETGQFRVPIVFDNLIHQGAMPVTIGLFVNPGHHADELPPSGWGKKDNRSVEYDTLSDDYARLLLDELLPEVGMSYRLSDDPERRAICGISSGGICAFTVAWQRPDRFRKVLSHVGSFTNIKGGHVYPALIRKTRPVKPIRVFLQDGDKDLDNEHGNWWLSNQQMAKALAFAGYDHHFVAGVGGHDGNHGGAILPESLRWLWRERQVWPDKDWPRATPADEGIDGAVIDALIADIDAGRYGLVDHLLLMRHGRVVSDRHFVHDYRAISAPREPKDHQYDYDHPRWHPYYRGTSLHTLQSVTKSITSICIGIALDEGLIPAGVATPAMSFFSAYEPDLADPRRRAMTLEDLLTMRSGIDWNEMISYDDTSNSCILMEASDDWIRYVLGRPMREAPGTRFDYNSGVSVLLGKIVRVATGKRIDEYAQEKLFGPLGITDVHWKVTPAGEIDTEGGLYLSAHDLARVAYLFLREGRWRDRQIVSSEWVQRSVTPHVADVQPDNGRHDRGYGYQWWIPEHRPGKTFRYQGSGYGGQLPIVVPELDLVIVINAWNIHEQPERSTWSAVEDVILPAVSDRPR